MSEEFTPILPLAELADGTLRACEVNGRAIVLCRSSGVVHALDDLCTHAEARMSEGRLRRGRLICPMHGAAFDLSDGRPLSGPATRALRCHEVRVQAGVIEVRLAGGDATTPGA